MATSINTAPHPALISGTRIGLALEGGETDYPAILKMILSTSCSGYY
jgi:hypothetical protein